ncbi:hypothetical protein [Flavisericum labens]
MERVINLLFLLFIGANFCSVQFISTDDQLNLVPGAIVSGAT